MDGEDDGRWLLAPDEPVPPGLGRQDPVLSLGSDLPDFNRILVNRGPGRYTGLRVGLAMAQALAMTRRVPVICFEMTDSLVRRFRRDEPEYEGSVGVLVDARAESVVTATYTVGKGRQDRIDEVRCCAAGEAVSGWAGDMVVVGSGVELHRPELAVRGFRMLDLDPDAKALAELAREGHGQEMDPVSLTPIYARSPV